MIIYGKPIADRIFEENQKKAQTLKSVNIHPTLAIINISSDPSSSIYVSEKMKAAEKLDVKIILDQTVLPESELLEFINKLNNNPLIHGIIIQLPLPEGLNEEKIINQVNPEKDVDGFKTDSKHPSPVAQSVLAVLEEISIHEKAKDIPSLLRNKKVVVIGKGRTAGRPIFNMLKKLKTDVFLIDSQTAGSQNIIKESDVIISCVGKKNILVPYLVKQNAIVIGVGMHNEEGKLRPDYDINKLIDKTSFITPVPLGIGPINVAYLFKNVLTTCFAKS